LTGKGGKAVENRGGTGYSFEKTTPCVSSGERIK
jgi:hypothetical protein